MRDKDLGRRFRYLVKNKGVNAVYHKRMIAELKWKWPLLWRLIKDVENDR